MNQRNLATFTLVYALTFAFFIITPSFLHMESGILPGFTWGDALDLLTPLVLIPMAGILYAHAMERFPGPLEMLAFILVAGLWAQGQGMHLATNSLNNLFPDFPASSVTSLIHYYDEVLGHYLWHAGIIGLSLITMLRAARAPEPATGGTLLVYVAGLVYGFAFFLLTVEGATVLMGLPVALLVAIYGVWRERSKKKLTPLETFFIAAYTLAFGLLLIWGVWHRGFPEFSQIGFL